MCENIVRFFYFYGMKNALFLLFLLNSITLAAQIDNDTIFYPVISCSGLSVGPEYPGGEASFNKLLKSGLKKRSLKKLCRSDSKLTAVLTIEKNGQISDISIPELDDKELKIDLCNVIKSMLKGSPAIKNGVPLISELSLPIKQNYFEN